MRGGAEYRGRAVRFLWLGVQQVSSCGHTCGLGMLHPVRWRMRVPVGMKGDHRACRMLSLCPYHTFTSTHLRQQPTMFFVCLLIAGLLLLP